MKSGSMKAVLIIGAMVFPAACGSGSGGGGGTTPVASPSSGTFVDNVVQGLGYKSLPSDLAGKTDATGHYQYMPGDAVTFDIGGRLIGTVPGGPQATALSVFGATSITDPRVVNLSQLLLTLGGTPTGKNPIQLPATIPPGLPNPINFSDPNFTTMLQNALPGATVVTQAQATTHLQTSFKTLSVTVVNSGTVTSDPAGISCTAGTCSYDFVTDTAVDLTELSTGFTGWIGDCQGTGLCNVTMNVTHAVTATFPVAPPPATLTISKAGTGTGTVNCSANGGAFGACVASYPNGTALTIQGVADNGSTFTGWSNGTRNISCTGTSNCSVTLTADSSVTATFTPNVTQFSVTANTVTTTGGGGTVQCSANGGAAGACGSYPVGTPVSAIATPNSASNFIGWTATVCTGTGTCDFTLTANTTVTANFNRPTLTVIVSGTGSVSSNPTGINNCTTTCSAPFDKATVTLTASEAGFTGWSGAGCTGAGSCVLALTNDTTVIATFGGNALTAPTLVQHYASPFEALFTSGDYTFHPPNATLAGNLLIVGIQISGSSTGVSISDDKSGSWTAGPSILTADNQIVRAFYQANNPGGITSITIRPSGTSQYFSFVFTEVYNVATSSPLDSSTSTQMSAPSVNAGSMATTVDGDYIWTVGCDTTVNDGLVITGITPGTGATLLSADRNSGIVVQQQIQASAGSITPAFRVNGLTDTFGAVSMAFKAAPAGTAPSATPRITKLITQSIGTSQGSSFTMQFPSSGTTMLMTYNSEVGGLGQPTTVSTLTDSMNNTWSLAVGPAECTTCAPASTEIWYAKNATTSPTLSITLTPIHAYAGPFNATLNLYDIVGLDLSNPLDVIASASGTQVGVDNLSTITITPTTANGLVVTSAIIDAHSLNGLSSPAGTFDCLSNSTSDGNDTTLCEANGMAHYYNSTTSSETWVWTTQNNTAGVLGWASVGAAFKAASGP